MHYETCEDSPEWSLTAQRTDHEPNRLIAGRSAPWDARPRSRPSAARHSTTADLTQTSAQPSRRGKDRVLEEMTRIGDEVHAVTEWLTSLAHLPSQVPLSLESGSSESVNPAAVEVLVVTLRRAADQIADTIAPALHISHRSVPEFLGVTNAGRKAAFARSLP